MPETMEKTQKEFKTWSQERCAHFEWVAQQLMPPAGREPKLLVGAMRYAVLGGGKRVRPLLVYAAGKVTGAPEAVLDRCALALEYIHSYSLVHDDMPAMDNDTLRRGKPTCHVRYGEATAMLAGDALQSEAFSVLAATKTTPETVVRLVSRLARAAGFVGMCGGQAMDLSMVGEADVSEPMLSRMQAMKTGALIEAAVLMGAQSGDFDRLSDMAKSGLVIYAQALGVLFQVVDDILDCTEDTATLGKTAGKDEKDDKPTWVSILGLDGARVRAQSLHADAMKGLSLVENDPAVPCGSTDLLKLIADYILLRHY